MEIVGVVLLAVAVIFGNSQSNNQPPEEPVILIKVDHRSCEFADKEVRYSNLIKEHGTRVYLKNNVPCVIRTETGINYERVLLQSNH